MHIESIKVGSLPTNCYVIADPQSKEALLIDPGDEAAKIIPAIKGLNVRYIVITHGHPDHFGALDELKKITRANILMNNHDSWFFKPDKTLNEGDEIRIGSLIFKVLLTPGHSQGSLCLYCEGHLFSGDTLFWGTYGRTDLPGGNEQQMRSSLKRLSLLPEDTRVYPGHGAFTTIKQEKENGTFD